MVKWIIRGSVAAFLTATAMLCLPVSSARADGTDVLIDKVLIASGLAGQLDGLAETIFSFVPGDAFSGEKEARKAEAFVKKEADGDVLLAMVKSAMKEHFDKQNAEKEIEFFSSRLGKKVSRLQKAALEPEALRQAREVRKTVALADERRQAAIRRIVNAERLTETNSALIQNMFKGLVDGALGTGENSPGNDREELKLSEIDRRLGDDAVGEVSTMAVAHTFRSLDDDDMEALATHYESEQAEWFRKAVRNGLGQAVYRIGKSLGEAMKNQQSLAGTEK